MVQDRNKTFDFTLPPQFSASRARVVSHESETEEDPRQSPRDDKRKARDDKGVANDDKEEKKKIRARTSVELEKETLEKIKNVKTKEELVNSTMGYLSSIFERTAILLVTKTHIVGWQGEGGSFGKNIKNVNIPIELESVFKYVIDKKKHYCGIWNSQRGDHLFYESLETTRSDDITALPVISNNKVFAIFYADNYKVNPHHITSSEVELEGIQHVAQGFASVFITLARK